jgi:hypothetical protein
MMSADARVFAFEEPTVHEGRAVPQPQSPSVSREGALHRNSKDGVGTVGADVQGMALGVNPDPGGYCPPIAAVRVVATARELTTPEIVKWRKEDDRFVLEEIAFPGA